MIVLELRLFSMAGLSFSKLKECRHLTTAIGAGMPNVSLSLYLHVTENH
jgi:hypothetical protein